MAGRGVDIKLGGNPSTPEDYSRVKELGGLYVIGTERHDARRIDNQLRGRAGRQGDPGETQFFVSLEDKLMRIFASDTVKNLMGRLGIPEDEPIRSGVVTRSLESAQEKIEGVHFDSRKHVLGFDDVLNHQRSLIYSKRRAILTGAPEEVLAIAEEHMANAGQEPSVLEAKKTELGEGFIPALRRLMLSAYDLFWIEHLETMEHLRGSVNLLSYGGRDPFIEFRREGLRLFRDLEASLSGHIAHEVGHLGQTNTPAPLRVVTSGPKKYGRNDQVTVTNGTETKQMKYKKAEVLLGQGWRLIEGETGQNAKIGG
jgi:preprotein translocase subunit SecA